MDGRESKIDVLSVCAIDVKVSIKMSPTEVSEAIRKISSLWGSQLPLMRWTVSAIFLYINQSLTKLMNCMA